MYNKMAQLKDEFPGMRLVREELDEGPNRIAWGTR